MKAEDTVMKEEIREEIKSGWLRNCFKDTKGEWLKSVILDSAQIQAGITWLIAEEVMYEASYIKAAEEWEEAVKRAYKAGQMEVVEFIEANSHICAVEKHIRRIKWQAFLKENGLG